MTSEEEAILDQANVTSPVLAQVQRRYDRPASKKKVSAPSSGENLQPEASNPAPCWSIFSPMGWPRFKSRPLVLLLTGMLIMLALALIGTLIVLPFVNNITRHWQAGEAGVSHFHIDVGHGGQSRFLTQYYQGQAIIIEFVGGDASRSQVYALQAASNQPNLSRLVFLSTRLVNPSGKPEKPDLLVEVEGFAGAAVLYNTGTSFQTEQPMEVKG
jgi:hypothetical protein